MVFIHVSPALNLNCREDGRNSFPHICLISRSRLQKTQACFTPCSQFTLKFEIRCLASLDAVANQLEENPLRRKASIVFCCYNVLANHQSWSDGVKMWFSMNILPLMGLWSLCWPWPPAVVSQWEGSSFLSVEFVCLPTFSLGTSASCHSSICEFMNTYAEN